MDRNPGGAAGARAVAQGSVVPRRTRWQLEPRPSTARVFQRLHARLRQWLSRPSRTRRRRCSAVRCAGERALLPEMHFLESALRRSTTTAKPLHRRSDTPGEEGVDRLQLRLLEVSVHRRAPSGTVRRPAQAPRWHPPRHEVLFPGKQRRCSIPTPSFLRLSGDSTSPHGRLPLGSPTGRPGLRLHSGHDCSTTTATTAAGLPGFSTRSWHRMLDTLDSVTGRVDPRALPLFRSGHRG